MLIHQIYWDFTKKDIEINDSKYFPSVEKTRQYAIENDITYKLWTYENCDDLVKNEFQTYIPLWNSFRYDIQRVDFIRYCILYSRGGIYIDCDIYPIKDINHLFNKDYFFVKRVEKGSKSFPYNAVIGSHPFQEIFKKILVEIEQSTFTKQQMPIYDKWKGRLVFQTTGQYMLKRVLKKDKNILGGLLNIYNEKKKINIINETALFQDSNVSVWYEDMMSNNIPNN